MIWSLINLIFRFCGKIYFTNEKIDWISALKLSKSYNDEIIFDKVKKTYDDIIDKNYEFYERDGLTLRFKPDEKDLIKFLKKNKNETNSVIEVLDYGGSLGSRFFSNFNFIKNNKIKWNIVEQKKFVQYGKNFLENKFLSFYNNLEKCLSEKKINLVIFSGALQYLENYDEILKKIKMSNIKYIFLDNLPLSNNLKHRIFVQKIPKKIYESSYPIRIFSKKIFLDEIKKLRFTVLNLKEKKTIFYGFSYTTLVVENLDFH
jgi:putative methyltransferase (TIGR04325 family)